MAVADRADWTDAELLLAARGGDKAAFGVLVRRHRPMVVALARRLLGSGLLAADAAQEATVAALTGLDRLRSPERFGAWYAGIALNIARRWLREVSVGSLAEDHPDIGPTPDERAEAAEVARRVRHAVAALAPGQKQAVLAFYWQGLTHAEVALELGVSQGAVKARLHQARAALAPRLAPWVDHPKEATPMPSTEPTWVDMEIVDVRRAAGDDPIRQPHVVVLAERDGDRRLPIYIGAPEAIALACTLESFEMPRPMTYQLSARLLEATGAQVAEVRITRLAESTFYATVIVDRAGERAEVDARPSDALNLASVFGAPIRADAGVLSDPEAAGFSAWRDFPTRAPELVDEVRQRQSDMPTVLARIREQQGGTDR